MPVRWAITSWIDHDGQAGTALDPKAARPPSAPPTSSTTLDLVCSYSFPSSRMSPLDSQALSIIKRLLN